MIKIYTIIGFLFIATMILGSLDIIDFRGCIGKVGYCNMVKK